MVYNFTVVGDDPNVASLRDWSILDLNHNGKVDVAYDSWVDLNKNNLQDADEKPVGDWQLLKDMGCNTIRVYQMPTADARLREIYKNPGDKLTFFHPSNKELFRDLYARFGIRVIIGHYLGEWTIGSGAEWQAGTDYRDPVQRKRLLDCIRVMVEEHKDEPYTLMWMLGNENFNPYDHDNAEKEVEAFLTLVNEAAKLIHKLDPDHPVGLCNWQRAHLRDIGRFAPEIDILGVTAYFGPFGFGTLWGSVKMDVDRPLLITEYGCSAINKKGQEDEDYQVKYHKRCWEDIVFNKFGNKGVGNSIGGVVFSWCDQWYLDGYPSRHDITGDPNALPKGVRGEEWFGITSQGDGSHSPFLRQLRKTYFLYKNLWREG